jgi:hypothetical protein
MAGRIAGMTDGAELPRVARPGWAAEGLELAGAAGVNGGLELARATGLDGLPGRGRRRPPGRRAGPDLRRRAVACRPAGRVGSRRPRPTGPALLTGQRTHGPAPLGRLRRRTHLTGRLRAGTLVARA